MSGTLKRKPGDDISLAERAYQAIRERLVMLQIRPGAPIDDDAIARELGIGRTPVREALKRLQLERLVQAYPRRGTFATEVNITDLTHISEVRNQLEPAAAAVAADRATAGEREHLRELRRRLSRRAASSGADLMGVDMEIHRAIYAATHNPFLEDTLVQYDNLAMRMWSLFRERLPDLAPHVREHEALLEAIAVGDPQAAARLASAHVRNFEEAIRSVV